MTTTSQHIINMILYDKRQKDTMDIQIGFRWYGIDDPVPLKYIRQIPAVGGIVSALYDVKIGDVWPVAKIASLKRSIEDAGLRLLVIESIPVHEDIKLGRPTRDAFIDNYCQSIRNMGSLGIGILCYNFMPVFDWSRSSLDMELADGSTTLSYDHEQLKNIDLKTDSFSLPGWATAYTKEELNSLLDAYSDIDNDVLWENLEYFLKRVVPVAEKSGVRMAIHPDDPPWSIFGLPRIITDGDSLDRLLSIVNSSANGVTFCTGSLGPNREMDILESLRKLSAGGRVPFVHMRNIARSGEHSFHETAHPSKCGAIDMYRVMKILVETGFSGVVRPDHGRMIWGEEGKPGYGLYDRALGAMYLEGLREALEMELGEIL
jgi:mannonate dehydratase